MKKFLLLCSLLLVSLGVFAQNNTLKFLGIPVDGKKQNVITALKEKGFTYDAYNDCLEGRFNGKNVSVYVLENNGKVHRIVVLDKHSTSEGQIIIAYNTLLDQFENNAKYIADGDNEVIPSTEDVSYEMTVHNKQYAAAFCLKDNPNGSVWFTINEKYGDYRIAIFYDNLENHSHGEDL